MGYLVFEGGAEFGGRMAAPDRRALSLAGGNHTRVVIIPAAAAPDNNHHQAGQNGVKWFQTLGADNIVAPPLIDRQSADDPAIVDMIRRAKLIYFLGGFPDYLAETMAGSTSWKAVTETFREKAVIAGSSAGAMVLCEYYYSPSSKTVRNGLKLIPGACVLPHHNTFGYKWADVISDAIPDTWLFGIDEKTGIINDGPDGCWRIYGKGTVTLYRDKRIKRYGPGDCFQTAA